MKVMVRKYAHPFARRDFTVAELTSIQTIFDSRVRLSDQALLYGQAQLD